MILNINLTFSVDSWLPVWALFICMMFNNSMRQVRISLRTGWLTLLCWIDDLMTIIFGLMCRNRLATMVACLACEVALQIASCYMHSHRMELRNNNTTDPFEVYVRNPMIDGYNIIIDFLTTCSSDTWRRPHTEWTKRRKTILAPWAQNKGRCQDSSNRTGAKIQS